jgi:hypothetical protein
MTVPIPTELEQAVIERARLRQQSVEELVRDALESYLRMESDDELNAWQEVRDEALRLVEDAHRSPRTTLQPFI